MIEQENNMPFISEKELLKQIPIPKSTFLKFKYEWVQKGNCLTQMGMFHIEGSGLNYWNVKKLFQWLLDYKIKQPAVFNNEVRDRDVANNVVLVLRNKGRRRNEKKQ